MGIIFEYEFSNSPAATKLKRLFAAVKEFCTRPTDRIDLDDAGDRRRLARCIEQVDDATWETVKTKLQEMNARGIDVGPTEEERVEWAESNAATDSEAFSAYEQISREQRLEALRQGVRDRLGNSSTRRVVPWPAPRRDKVWVEGSEQVERAAYYDEWPDTRTHFERLTKWQEDRSRPEDSRDFDDVEFKFHRGRLMAEEDAEKYSALGFDVQLILVHPPTGHEIRVRYSANPNHANFVKEVCDSTITAEGALVSLGDDFDGARLAVQQANDLKPTERNADGKIIKGDKYVAPDMGKFIGVLK